MLFNNTYAQLPERFYARQAPIPVREPALLVYNEQLAADLGIAANDDLAALFSGNTLLDGAEPLAQAYAGHQFGHFVPQLGDGRAVLLGEILDQNEQRYDIQLKGAGQTAFSRGGDGRAALGPVLREYLISEAMHKLGIATTRSLAVVSTGEPVFRETPLPGAILTRIASSHLRIGTFQYFAAQQDTKAVKILYEYARDRHYPNAHTPLEFLQAVLEKQAKLVSDWLCIGFIHGVMNTDNSSISGETIDYGPCAFMDTYDPQTVFSSIDRRGRYAYANQPNIAQWNLTRLAECLLPLIDKNEETAAELAEERIQTFAAVFQKHWLKGMRYKLGLLGEQSEDEALIGALLQEMQQSELDYTNTFRGLYRVLKNDTNSNLPAKWLQRWRQRLQQEDTSLVEQTELMRRHNPAYIPRNHLVEEALTAAYSGNLQPFKKLHQVLQNPFEEYPEQQVYTLPPTPEQRVYQTFCGT